MKMPENFYSAGIDSIELDDRIEAEKATKPGDRPEPASPHEETAPAEADVPCQRAKMDRRLTSFF